MAQPFQASLSKLAADGADAGRVPRRAATTWRAIDAALSPIIGPRGVTALYRRSLHLARTANPALGSVYDGELIPGDYAGLETVLSGLTTPDATVANAALLDTFYDLLVKLIGESLAEQLLRPALDLASAHPLSGGDLAKDTAQ